MRKELLVAVVVGLGACGAHAQSVTLGAQADARGIFVFGDSNFGVDFLSVFTEGSNVQRTYIKFDLGAIPSGQTITSATLRLFGTRFGGLNTISTTNVFRLTESFVENQVTWNSRSTGTPWATQGGSFVGTTGVQGTNPYATLTRDQATDWYEWDVTTLVGEWNNGTHANHGFALTALPTNSLTFTSREGLAHANIGAQNVPQLVVNYQPVPEPATLAALGLGALAMLRRKRRAS